MTLKSHPCQRKDPFRGRNVPAVVRNTGIDVVDCPNDAFRLIKRITKNASFVEFAM